MSQTEISIMNIEKSNSVNLEKFRSFIIHKEHPCVMAQSVMMGDKVHLRSYSELGTRETAKKLIKDIDEYLSQYDFSNNDFYTFIAAFGGNSDFDENLFEKLLWKQLRYISEEDEAEWDPEVSDEPDNENFSFSIAGKAFYVVGMHPNSSRFSRRAPMPALVFNLHGQFEKLRDMGVYQQVRDRIRDRDLEFQGSINPMLEDFGNSSEAKQYSGRKVDESWKCPFHAKQKETHV